MNDKRTQFIERLMNHFYDNEAELNELFTAQERERILRLRQLDRYILKNPMQPDYMNVNYLVKTFNIKERQAYYDLQDLRLAVGTFAAFNKEYARRELSQGLLDMMLIARDTQNVNGYARLAKEYNSINRLDKDDIERVDTKRRPLSLEPTCDLSALGYKNAMTPEEELKLQKSIRERDQKRFAQDVEYEEVAPSDRDPFYESLTTAEKEEKQAYQTIDEI